MYYDWTLLTCIKLTPGRTLRPEQNCWHFVDGATKCIFVIESVCILIGIMLNIIPYGLMDMSALVQVMTWSNMRQISTLLLSVFDVLQNIIKCKKMNIQNPDLTIFAPVDILHCSTLRYQTMGRHSAANVFLYQYTCWIHVTQ